MQLVFDRTEADVLLGNEKGNYSYIDLNRVEQAVSELRDIAKTMGFQAALTTKTDWGTPGAFSADTWVTHSQLQRYLQNVHYLCQAFAVQEPQLPDTMEQLDRNGANAIERALHIAYQRVQNILNSYYYSGEIFAGEELL